MLEDEYQVTFWTRGQYPAAPPRHDDKNPPTNRADFLYENNYFGG